VDEIWKPIAGWEGFYEVSTHGRVCSLDRVVPDSRNGQKRVKGRILKPSAGTPYLPYAIVTLHRGGRRGTPGSVIEMPYVHTLVLETFVGPRPEGMQACHDPDRDGMNNRLDNLRWDTPKANQQDSIRHGTHAQGKGKSLTPDQKADVLARKADGESSLSIAADIGCCRSTVDRAWRLATLC
jgi:hypothetical protein